jgi:hypothetical protein
LENTGLGQTRRSKIELHENTFLKFPSVGEPSDADLFLRSFDGSLFTLATNSERRGPMCLAALSSKNFLVLFGIFLTGMLLLTVLPWVVIFRNSPDPGIAVYIICSVFSAPFLIAFFWLLPEVISCYKDARAEKQVAANSH